MRLAELVREQVLRRTREELPHAVEVEVDEIAEREDGLLMIEARVWTESESQKAILIGKGGGWCARSGTAAREEIEAALGRRVHLDLSVRVRKGWRRDEACSTGSGSSEALRDSPGVDDRLRRRRPRARASCRTGAPARCSRSPT